MGANPLEILALDIGQQRTGTARASSVARLPEPLETLSSVHLLSELPLLVSRLGSQAIVIGLPRDLNQRETEQTAWVRQIARELMGVVAVPFYWIDETLTTVAAEDYRRAHKLQSVAIDSIAACIILQDFLAIEPGQREEYRL